jgi:hypothetical protein
MLKFPEVVLGFFRRHGMLKQSVCLTVCLALPCTSVLTSAHTLEEIQQAFADGTDGVPQELVDVTRQLDSTAGTKSVREQVHATQHRLLLEYLRARTAQKCADFTAKLPDLDRAIIESREAERREEEQRLRDVRDTAQAFLSVNCKELDRGPGEPLER